MKSYKRRKRLVEKNYPPCVATSNRSDPLTDFEVLSQLLRWGKVYLGLSFKGMVSEMLAHSNDGSYSKEQFDLLDSLAEDESRNS